jgi:V8-like Glu-specific endopeptidase
MLGAAAIPAQAQDQDQREPVVRINPAAQWFASAYWTAERFKAAKPLPLPLATPGTRREVQPAAPTGQPAASDGQLPTEPPGYAGQQLFSPGAEAAAVGAANPGAVGSFGAHYTSTRVFPMFDGAAAPYSADRGYPYRTVGILFFSIDGVPYLCSASVIQRRVVATAGHCVHSGTSAGFHDNWVFVPSYRDGSAPFKMWNWRLVSVTSTWATGGGGVPNAADYAMIEFSDQPLYPNAKPTKLGYVTGWLGWQTQSLIPNHTSKLGYPCNLDSCGKMQNVTSNSFAATSPNNVEYGSDARGGSSGGPWVQNFQILAQGGGTGLNTGSNRVVGVTSYGYVEEEPKVQGASIPDSRWIGLWNLMCGQPGNCVP